MVLIPPHFRDKIKLKKKMKEEIQTQWTLWIILFFVSAIFARLFFHYPRPPKKDKPE
jgi:hypothetical protein